MIADAAIRNTQSVRPEVCAGNLLQERARGLEEAATMIEEKIQRARRLQPA